MAATPPWKRANPKRTPTKLTEASKASARARARRAGRTYPNLIDNMYAAQQQAAGPTKKRAPAKKRAAAAKPSKRATRTAAR